MTDLDINLSNEEDNDESTKEVVCNSFDISNRHSSIFQSTSQLFKNNLES